MMVVSVIATSTPNGSSGAAVAGGGGVRLGICAEAPDRPKPTTRAAPTGSHKIREATIGISPAGPYPCDAVRRTWACRRWPAIHPNTRSGEPLVIKLLQ